MENDSSSNIFDMSSKMGASRKKKPASPEAPLPAPPPMKTPPIESETGPVTTYEVQQMIQKMKDMYYEIDHRADEIIQTYGVSSNKLKKYLSDKKNFRPEVWEEMQRTREARFNELWNLIGIEEKAKLAQNEQQEQSKERRAKTIGSRKRGWISM